MVCLSRRSSHLHIDARNDTSHKDLVTPIEDYIQKPQAERQSHLKLSEPCDERGGMSSYFKGLLAYHVGTSIPSGRAVQVCHACHNGACSNVSHLYWGTPSENRADAISQGKPISPYHANVMRVGVEEANRLQSRPRNKNGIGNSGGSKSEEHKAKIAETIRRKHAEGKYDNAELGRKKKLLAD